MHRLEAVQVPTTITGVHQLLDTHSRDQRRSYQSVTGRFILDLHGFDVEALIQSQTAQFWCVIMLTRLTVARGDGRQGDH